jgi:hypothetical protein
VRSSPANPQVLIVPQGGLFLQEGIMSSEGTKALSTFQPAGAIVFNERFFYFRRSGASLARHFRNEPAWLVYFQP